jgi:hypothetical protein
VLVSAVILGKQAPDLPITALVTSAAGAEALSELGRQHAVPGPELMARTLAAAPQTPQAGDLIVPLVVAPGGRLPIAEVAPAGHRRSQRHVPSTGADAGHRPSGCQTVLVSR